MQEKWQHKVKETTIQAMEDSFCEDISCGKMTICHHNTETTVTVNSSSLMSVLSFLKDNNNCKFAVLVDICGADFPHLKERFEIIYHLLSLSHNQRIRVKTKVSNGQEVESATSLFQNANWYEREVFDMYGVAFTNHPDMRRILTDYSFKHNPLRKDFPLTGFEEVYYDLEEKAVKYKPVELTQEYRSFDFLTPWTGENKA